MVKLDNFGDLNPFYASLPQIGAAVGKQTNMIQQQALFLNSTAGSSVSESRERTRGTKPETKCMVRTRQVLMKDETTVFFKAEKLRMLKILSTWGSSDGVSEADKIREQDRSTELRFFKELFWRAEYSTNGYSFLHGVRFNISKLIENSKLLELSIDSIHFPDFRCDFLRDSDLFFRGEENEQRTHFYDVIVHDNVYNVMFRKTCVSRCMWSKFLPQSFMHDHKGYHFLVSAEWNTIHILSFSLIDVFVPIVDVVRTGETKIIILPFQMYAYEACLANTRMEEHVMSVTNFSNCKRIEKFSDVVFRFSEDVEVSYQNLNVKTLTKFSGSVTHSDYDCVFDGETIEIIFDMPLLFRTTALEEWNFEDVVILNDINGCFDFYAMFKDGRFLLPLERCLYFAGWLYSNSMNLYDFGEEVKIRNGVKIEYFLKSIFDYYFAPFREYFKDEDLVSKLVFFFKQGKNWCKAKDMLVSLWHGKGHEFVLEKSRLGGEMFESYIFHSFFNEFIEGIFLSSMLPDPDHVNLNMVEILAKLGNQIEFSTIWESYDDDDYEEVKIDNFESGVREASSSRCQIVFSEIDNFRFDIIPGRTYERGYLTLN